MTTQASSFAGRPPADCLALADLATRRASLRMAWIVAAFVALHLSSVRAEVLPYYQVDDIVAHDVSPVAPQFATAEDVTAFQSLTLLAQAFPSPDAKSVAKAFLQEALGIEGDDYVVAHFAGAEARSRGVPDRTLPLTEALMEAFPDHSRHGFFSGVSDAVGGLSGGGAASQGVVPLAVDLAHSRDVQDFFRTMGRFLWSRTGPGYLYNTFFAKGNVVDTVREDLRPVDEAFGIYRAGGFTAEHATSLRLSRLVARFDAADGFSELPFVKRLDDAMERYWKGVRPHWAVLARYEFVRSARHARDTGQLGEAQFRLAMKGGAPRVPLSGAITLAQLRGRAPAKGVEARRLDINGYTATDLVRFIAPDGSEVMYVPGGEPAFVVAGSEGELRAWVLAQARDAGKLDALLRHFSAYDSQDGVFWTGVRHGLEKLGNGQWLADGRAIDHANALIDGDVFSDMRERTEKRWRADARMQASTSWEAWRTTIHRTLALVGPLGYVPLFAIPVQVSTGIAGVGTGIEQAIDGRTAGERNRGAEGAVSAVVNAVPLGTIFSGLQPHGAPDSAEVEPTFVPPRRVNGQIGYPLGPELPPGWPVDRAARLYRRRDGTPALWSVADLERHAVRLPREAAERADGILIHDSARYAQLVVRGRGIRTVRVVSDTLGYRIRLQDGTAGPRVERQPNGTWQLAFNEHDYLAGSLLAEFVSPDATADARSLNRAAEVLAQFGIAEARLAELDLAGRGAETVPVVSLALGHGFLETLAARLRDPRVDTWSAGEVQLIAPAVARQAGRPIAFYRQDGRFLYGVSADGLEFRADAVPPGALRVSRLPKGYAVLSRQGGVLREHPSLFGAVVESLTSHALDKVPRARREMAFRQDMADAMGVRMSRGDLQRMHRLWLEPLLRSAREKRVLRRLSRLRHAILDEEESLTDDQQRWLRNARTDLDREPPARSEDPRAEALALLPALVEAESALLPEGLDHLLVTDPEVGDAGVQLDADQWSLADRHYVRLRHLDGRSQIVETGPPQVDGTREILMPGDGAERGTGRHVVDLDGMWFPEGDVREGYAPIDPREYAEALSDLAARLPGEVDDDFANVERIVDSIPHILLRFIRSSLRAVTVTADGSLDLEVVRPGTRRRLAFATRRDTRGQAVPRPGASRPPWPVTPIPTRDAQLILPVPEGIDGVQLGPMPDPAAYIELLQSERPLSAFIGAGMGDRHVRALVTTRRLRGMLREDAHMAVMGATAEHVVTLVMPVNADTLAFVASGEQAARPIAGLPAGTVVVDDMYGVRASTADYAGHVRAVARRWEASGATIKRILPTGTEEHESPVAFTERLLSAPVRANLWNPRNDPISEVAYVDYLRGMHESGKVPDRAGLDWLRTREARRDYMRYFAPPYDVLPGSEAPPATDLPATRLYRLAEAAVELGLSLRAR